MRTCVECLRIKEDRYFEKERTPKCIYCNSAQWRSKLNIIKDKIKQNEGLGSAPMFKYFGVSKEIKVNRETAVKLIHQGKAFIYNPESLVDLNSFQWKVIKIEVLERDGYLCHYCGQIGNTIDHIVPKSQGGTDELDNLVCSCPKCNELKSNNRYSDFNNSLTIAYRNAFKGKNVDNRIFEYSKKQSVEETDWKMEKKLSKFRQKYRN